MKKLSVLTLSLILAGCGGGGSSSPSAVITTPLDGVVAVGAPLPGATVVLKDANGKTTTTTADANGKYRFSDVAGYVAPLMIQASGTAGGKAYVLHSVLNVAPASGVAGVLNVTPATQAVVAQATGVDPATVFADSAKIKVISPTQLNVAKAKLIAALASVWTALGVDSTKVDLFTTAFTANNSGLDKLLDTISFDTLARVGGGQDIQVANKNGGATITIAPAATLAAVAATPVTAPSAADLALDTATIKTLLAALTEQFKTTTSLANSGAALDDLLDPAYLYSGKDKAAQLAQFRAAPTNKDTGPVGIQLLSYVQQGCSGETKVCKGSITNKRADGTLEEFPMAVKFDTATSKWRLYGNRAPFEFEFNLVANANYTVASGATSVGTPSIQTGFHFYFSGSGATAGAYRSAKVWSSVDSGTNWTQVAAFKPKANCPTDWLQTDDQTTNCSNFVAVDDTNAGNSNTALDAGTKRTKIEAFTTADYSGTPIVHEYRPTKRLLTSVTGAAVVANGGQGITASQLGTSSVSYTGGTNNVQIRVWTSGSETGQTHWDKAAAKAINGVATVAKANASCVTNGLSQAVCDASYGSTATIQSVFLSTRDNAGNQIWSNFHR
jgi:hypothetical protein